LAMKRKKKKKSRMIKPQVELNKHSVQKHLGNPIFTGGQHPTTQFYICWGVIQISYIIVLFLFVTKYKDFNNLPFRPVP